MTVTITGFAFGKGGGVRLYAEDTDEYRLQKLERNRYDDGGRELEFVFPRTSYDYLYGWLKRQKSVKKASPETLGDAIRATVGTVTTISGKYIEFE